MTDRAQHPWSWWHALAGGVAGAGLVALFQVAGSARWMTAGALLALLGVVVVAVKLLAVLVGLASRRHAGVVQAVPDEALPTYSLLIPLYREAAVIADLIVALDRIDYPRDRLQALLLIEADDAETAAAFAAQAPPAWIRAIIVPAGTPRTKPRACNVGLSVATGERLVIFDAEDRPEPDQLRRAVAAFAAGHPRLGCVQAHLAIDNRNANWLTACFALEYAVWFDAYLPGLAALGSPVPLGGTSNHFPTALLREVGGWDAWNVTEDCDLGMRLARRGWQTEVLDSTTWEEAPQTVGVWIRQRTRWMKGYVQTSLVHSARPLCLLRDLGLRRSVLLLIVTAGQVASHLVTLPCLALGIMWLWWRWPLWDPHLPWTASLVALAIGLLLINAVFLCAHAIAGWRRGYGSLAGFALALPLYWLFASVATWRGVWQFFSAPFSWEKTTHGGVGVIRQLAQPRPSTERVTAAARVSGRRRAALLLALMAMVCAAIAWQTPAGLGFGLRVRMATITMQETPVVGNATIEASWVEAESVQVMLALPVREAQTTVARAIIHLRVEDGEWFQQTCSAVWPPGAATALSVPLSEGWTAEHGDLPWSRDWLRRVREIGVQLFLDGESTAPESFTLSNIALIAAPTPPPPIISELRVEGAAIQGGVVECRFALGRSYANPYDPAQIDLWWTLTAPDGSTTRGPCFYGRDFFRPGADDQLVARGAPYWAARCRSRQSGDHLLTISGRDAHTSTIQAPPLMITITPGSTLAMVRRDPSGPWFCDEDGHFVYPIPMTIRSPDDALDEQFGTLVPKRTSGEDATMLTFIDKLAAAGMTVGRVWQAPWYAGLEWRGDWPGFHGSGAYNLANAWRIDALLARARSHGVRLEFAIFPHITCVQYGEKYTAWKDNPWNHAIGGFLDPRLDAGTSAASAVFTNPEARRLARQRLRYIAARWGADAAVFGWTLWIEADAVQPHDGPLVAWHREMIDVLAECDTGRHLVSTEFRSSAGRPAVFALPGIDYTQLAGYTKPGQLPATFRERAMTLKPLGKPGFIEEYGGAWNAVGNPAVYAREIHDGLWAAWCMPFAAAPMTWWWNLTFAQHLDRFHHRFAAVIADEDRRGSTWTHRIEVLADAPMLRAIIRSDGHRACAWVHHGRWSNDANEPGSPGFAPFSVEPGQQFADINGAHLPLAQLGLQPGHYLVRCFDTWSEAAPLTMELTSEATAIALPPLTRDLAIIVTPLP